MAEEEIISCPQCHKKVVIRAKYCPYCGYSLLAKSETTITKDIPVDNLETSIPSKQTDEEPTQDRVVKFKTDTFLEFLNSSRKNFSKIIMILGILSLIAAVAFTIIVFLPKDIVEGIQIPPIEGYIFDILVVMSFLLLLGKVLVIRLGFIRKKTTLDQWFSFGILLLLWVNLLTLSLGLVETSVFFQIGMEPYLLFILLMLINLCVALLYYIRYFNPAFSGSFIIMILSSLYLLEWLIPLDPIVYTTLVYLVTGFICIFTIKMKDLLLYIGEMLLIPSIFLSPYILSNSNVFLASILLVSFPVIFLGLLKILPRIAFIDQYKRMIELGKMISYLGILTVSFSVIYGYLKPEILPILLLIPMFIQLPIRRWTVKKYQDLISDYSLEIVLLITFLILDIITIDKIVLHVLAGFILFQSCYVYLNYRTIEIKNFQRYSLILFLMSQFVISISNVEFIWKLLVLCIPIFLILVSDILNRPINHEGKMFISFSSTIFILLGFLRSPLVDILLIPLYSSVGLITLLMIYQSTSKWNQEQYSLTMTIYSIIYQISLLTINFYTVTLEDMLIPVIILIVFCSGCFLWQIRKKISPKYSWFNASFLLCFASMTFWNEYEGILIIGIFLILNVASLINLRYFSDLSQKTERQQYEQSIIVTFIIQGLALQLIVFFELLNLFTHSFLFLLVIGTWLIIILPFKQKTHILAESLILLLPSVIFGLELLSRETLFTVITESEFLYTTLIILIIPAIILQILHYFRVEERLKYHPLILGCISFTFILLLSIETYSLIPEERLFLILVLMLGIIASSFFITQQYESGILLGLAITPVLVVTQMTALTALEMFLLPLLPILVNIVISLRSIKTKISLEIHEILLVTYLVLYVIISGTTIWEYVTFLGGLILVSWLLIGVFHPKIHSLTYETTKLVNASIVIFFILLINPDVINTVITIINIDLVVENTFISLTLGLFLVILFIQILHWQISTRHITNPIRQILVLLLNTSSAIILGIRLVEKTTFLEIEDLQLIILLSSGFLVLIFLPFFTFQRIINSELSLGCTHVTLLWLAVSSMFIGMIHMIFLWLILVPILYFSYNQTKERTLIFWILGLSFITGVYLLNSLSEFIAIGQPEWITIIGLVWFGVELITMGIHLSLSDRNSQRIIEEESSPIQKYD